MQSSVKRRCSYNTINNSMGLLWYREQLCCFNDVASLEKATFAYFNALLFLRYVEMLI